MMTSFIILMITFWHVLLIYAFAEKYRLTLEQTKIKFAIHDLRAEMTDLSFRIEKQIKFTAELYQTQEGLPEYAADPTAKPKIRKKKKPAVAEFTGAIE